MPNFLIMSKHIFGKTFAMAGPCDDVGGRGWTVGKPRNIAVSYLLSLLRPKGLLATPHEILSRFFVRDPVALTGVSLVKTRSNPGHPGCLGTTLITENGVTL